ncbi:DUF7507 domain-containing protein, partial [Rothia nasimurium]|uniref:DUF7507 domain-containing protein n=1 Tax=Rothia nasimurium TaxID=85336 RepID=UPI001F3BEC61
MNYSDVGLTIESTYIRAEEDRPLDSPWRRLQQATFTEDYFNSYKDCITAGGNYSVGQVIDTCGASRTVTYTFTKPVWYPQFFMRMAPVAIRSDVVVPERPEYNYPALTTFEDIKIININDGTTDRTASEYGDIEFQNGNISSTTGASTQADKPYIEGGFDAQGAYTLNYDTSKFAPVNGDASFLGDWTEGATAHPAIVPTAQDAKGQLLKQYGNPNNRVTVPGYVKEITFEYTPKFFVNSMQGIERYLQGGAWHDQVNLAKIHPDPAFLPRTINEARLPKTQTDVEKAFSAAQVAPGEEIQFTLDVTNPGYTTTDTLQYPGQDSFGYALIDALPAEIDPETVELVSAPLGEENYTLDPIAIDTATKKATLTVRAVNDAYTIADDGRVAPKPGTDNTVNPPVILPLNGAAQQWVFKAKVKSLAELKTNNSDICTSGLTMKNNASVYDSLVNANDPASATTQIVCKPSAITLDKTSSFDGSQAKAGDVVTYDFTVTNNGAADLTTFEVTDPLAGLSSITYPADRSLASGESKTVTATYTLTQADIERGTLDNTATATAVSGDPNVPNPDPATDDHNIAFDQVASFDFVKSSNFDATDAKAGDVVTYEFTVTNTGNVNLSTFEVTDLLPGLSAITYPADRTLAPKESKVATATYTLTQADINAGGVVNTAKATVTPENPNVPKPDPKDGTTEVKVDQKPAFTFVKSNSFDITGAKAGDTVEYQFTVTNTGNVTLDSFEITDDKVGAITYPADMVLEPGESAIATATYTLTQADINARKVVNNATATVDPAGNIPAPDPKEDTNTLNFDPKADYEFVKSSDYNAANAKVGDTVTYKFTVTNTGNVTLSDITVQDNKVGAVTVPAGTTLEPGKSLELTADYTLTQADINAGGVVNVATANVVPPTGVTPPAPKTDDDVIVIERNPDFAFVKSSDYDATNAKPGDVVTYQFTVTNTGDVDLATFDVVDPLPGLSAISYPADRTLAVGESKTATATYTLTQADINAGGVINTATASVTPVDPDPTDDVVVTPPAPKTDDHKIVVDRKADFEFVKSSNFNAANAKVGDTVTYTFTVTNTGNVDLSTFEINDPMVGLTNWVYPASRALPVGATATVTADYVLTQSDLGKGKIVNTAEASVVPADPTPEDPTDNVPTPPKKPGEETIVVEAKPDFTFEKTSDFNGATAKVDDTVIYEFTVTNTGNVDLSTFEIADGLEGLSAIKYPADRTLKVGESKTATATYVLTDADFVKTKVTNSATAAVTPKDETPEDPSDNITPPAPKTDDHEIPLPLKADFEFVKSSNFAGKKAKVGDKVTFTFAVTNTGNVALETFEIVDPTAGEITYPADRTLAVGETKTATAIYTVTQKDVNAGGVVNVATASVVPVDPTPGDGNNEIVPPAPKTDEENVVAEYRPDFDFAKTSDYDVTKAKAGDTVTYEFTVTNTGNVDLETFEITDPLAGLSALTYPADRSLKIGESKTATATYVLTQADINSGALRNTATASVVPVDPTPGDGNNEVVPPAPQTDNWVLAFDPKPDFEFVKSSDFTAESAQAGDTVTYTFAVTNTGNIDLETFEIVDPLPGLSAISYPADRSLAIGETKEATATYVLTQADIDKGSVVNTAEASVVPVDPTPGDGNNEIVPPAPKTDEEIINLKGQYGSVVVHFKNTNGEVIAPSVFDTTNAPVGTDYNTTDHLVETIIHDGNKYVLVPSKTEGTENGQVVEGQTEVTYVYQKVANWVPLIPPGSNVPGDPIPYPFDPTNPDSPIVPGDGNVIPHVPGYTPVDPKTNEPLKPVDPEDPTKGYVPPVPETPGVDTPIPYVKDEAPKTGNVIVKFKDIDGNPIEGLNPIIDVEGASVGTDYDTTEHKKLTYTAPDGTEYVYERVEGNETGTVVEGNTTVTYVLKKVEKPVEEPKTGSVVVKYTDVDGNPIPGLDDVNALVDVPVGTDYNTTEHKKLTYTAPDGTEYVYERVEGNENGQVVEGKTTVTYILKKVEKPVEEPKTGSVVVKYTDVDGNPIPGLDDVNALVDVPVGTDYNTTEHKKLTYTAPDGTEYVYERVEGNENGQVVEGETTVTYILKKVEKPVEEPKTGNVIVNYVDENGNPIGPKTVTDLSGAPVGTNYDTTDKKITEFIAEDGSRYVLVPSKTKGNENGTVVEGDTEVTYVYQKVANWIPQIPGVPTEDLPKIPYPFDPTNPDQPVDPNTPGKVVPHVPGYTPVDPKTNEPLKPVDPEDPSKGYVPPVPETPGVDTPIPYVPVKPTEPTEPPVDPSTPGEPTNPGEPTTPAEPSVPAEPTT